LLYRRVDIEDVVGAHLPAVEKARNIGFARFIISAATPFGRDDLAGLNRNAPEVVHRLFPECAELYGARGWRLFPRIDRVYVSHRAMAELTWKPKYDFRHALQCLRAGTTFAALWRVRLAARVMGPDCAGNRAGHPTEAAAKRLSPSRVLASPSPTR
jgi:UDP-glucose 4-epimerase